MPDNKIPMQPGAAQYPQWLSDLLKSWGSPTFWQQFASDFYNQLGAPARAVGIGRTPNTQPLALGTSPLGVSDGGTIQKNWKGEVITPSYTPRVTPTTPVDNGNYPPNLLSPEQQASQKQGMDFNNPNSDQNLIARLQTTGYDIENDPMGLFQTSTVNGQVVPTYVLKPESVDVINNLLYPAWQKQQATNTEFNKTQTGYGANGNMSKDQFARFGEQNYQQQLKSNATNAANNVTVTNEMLRNAMTEAQTYGVDTSWVMPKLQDLTYKMMAGDTTYPAWQGSEPENIVGYQLIQQVRQAKGMQDAITSQRLAAQYPMIYQRFQDITNAEAEQILASKQDLPVNDPERGYVGTPSFNTFLQMPQNNLMQQQIFQGEVGNITQYPKMYTQYLGANSNKSFMDWVKETPLKQATFNNLYNPPPESPASTGSSSLPPTLSLRESAIPRWAVPRVRF